MSEQEIPEAQWSTFLDRFSSEHRAWLATVDRIHAGAPDEVDAVERPLASVVPKSDSRRVATIEIRFQADSTAQGPIEIEGPSSVRVEEFDGVTRALEIVGRNGDRTRVRFRTAPRPETLDGVAPGELPTR